MRRLETILRQLKAQRASAHADVERLDRAIQALTSGHRRRRPGRRPGLPEPPELTGHISVAAQRRTAAAPGARGAKPRGERPTRNVSPEGRRHISELALRRWAASRQAHGDSLAPLRFLSEKEIAALQENAGKASVAPTAKAPEAPAV